VFNIDFSELRSKDNLGIALLCCLRKQNQTGRAMDAPPPAQAVN
jgi:hypothetical protein